MPSARPVLRSGSLAGSSSLPPAARPASAPAATRPRPAALPSSAAVTAARQCACRRQLHCCLGGEPAVHRRLGDVHADETKPLGLEAHDADRHRGCLDGSLHRQRTNIGPRLVVSADQEHLMQLTRTPFPCRYPPSRLSHQRGAHRDRRGTRISAPRRTRPTGSAAKSVSGSAARARVASRCARSFSASARPRLPGGDATRDGDTTRGRGERNRRAWQPRGWRHKFCLARYDGAPVFFVPDGAGGAGGAGGIPPARGRGPAQDAWLGPLKLPPWRMLGDDADSTAG